MSSGGIAMFLDVDLSLYVSVVLLVFGGGSFALLFGGITVER